MIIVNIFKDIFKPTNNTYMDGNFYDKILSIKNNNVIGVFNNYLICLVNDKLVIKRGDYNIRDFIVVTYKPNKPFVTIGGRHYNLIASYNNQYIFVKNGVPNILNSEKLPLEQHKVSDKYEYLYNIKKLTYLACDSNYLYFIDKDDGTIIKRENLSGAIPHISNQFLNPSMSKYRENEYLVGEFKIKNDVYLILYNLVLKTIRWVYRKSIGGTQIRSIVSNNQYSISNKLSYSVADYIEKEGRMFIFGINDKFEHIFCFVNNVLYPNEVLDAVEGKSNRYKKYHLSKNNVNNKKTYRVLYTVWSEWGNDMGEVIEYDGKVKFYKLSS